MTGVIVAPRTAPGGGAIVPTAARAAKLRASRDVRAVFAAGRTAVSRFAVVHALDRDAPGPARSTVVAGRKVGGAVDRNRVKRRLRAILRDAALRDGTDYVLVGRRGALQADAAQLRDAVLRQIAQAGSR